MLKYSSTIYQLIVHLKTVETLNKVSFWNVHRKLKLLMKQLIIVKFLIFIKFTMNLIFEILVLFAK